MNILIKTIKISIKLKKKSLIIKNWKMKTLMVVVGTTEFEELVKAIDNEEIMKTLINFGFNHIIFQIGKYTIIKNYLIILI